MTGLWSILGSLALLSANGFFVAAEFGLVAAKRHRFERAAASGDRAARAALNGCRQLSLMLAGAQLGVTLCTLGLGALAKPTVAELLEPGIAALGLPRSAAAGFAFAVAVATVAFLHVVVGELAPKSWAITNPERTTLLLVRPFWWFTTVTRPALAVLNSAANACLRLVRVTPRDELASAHGPGELRMLIESSREHGTLDPARHELLSAMLTIQHTVVDQVMIPADRMVCVSSESDAREIERVSRASGRSRLVVTDPRDRSVIGVVHVRDAARVTTSAALAAGGGSDGAGRAAGTPAGRLVTAAELMSRPAIVPRGTPVAVAVRQMRLRRAQLALVAEKTGRPVGLVALEDLLEELLGEFDDETDSSDGA